MNRTKMIIEQNKWFILFIFFILILRIFFFSPFKVEGASMQPSLYSGERGMYLKNSKIENSDIVILKDMTSGKTLIKRVIAIPNDKVKIEKELITLNGQPLEEPYLINYPQNVDINLLEQEFIIPEDSYFVLGDNRLNSKDSRQLGLIKKNDILGKVVTTFGIKFY